MEIEISSSVYSSFRARGDSAAVVGEVTRAAGFNQNISIMSMTEIREAMLQQSNLAAKIFGSISLVATALALPGMFSLIAFTVVQRKREIGIRIAIGATRRALVFGLIRLHA